MAALALPMILTNLAQMSMTTTDVIMMGRLGPQSLAAGALGGNLYFGPMMLGLGLMLATSPMIASELGRNRHSVRDVRRTVRQGLWLAVAASIPLWFFLWHGGAVLAWMGQDPQLSVMAGAYIRAMLWATLPFYGYIVLRNFISALERPGWALAIVLVAVSFNVFANWCLMFGNLGFPRLELVGAGIATTTSNILMFAGMALVVSLEKQFRRYRLFGRFWRPDWPRFVQLFKLGAPIAGILAFEVSIFNAATFLMGLIGPVALAAHAIAIQIASVSFMVPMSIGQAVTVRVGRAYGARNPDAVSLAGWTAFVIGVSFMALTALVMLLLPRLLIAAFIDTDDAANAAVVATAVTFLSLAALFQIVDGAQAVTSGMLRGLHDTAKPMVLAAIGYWGLGLPLSYILAFPAGMNGVGVWLGLFFGLAAVAVMLVVRWMRRDRLLN
ncbi:MATE family efflux transporter [Mesorhizobium sp. Z1-4]|uniref:MATE family efflux transporter n=1 Tax=Mesorhizobium sp. Z1-4 TaxID=2448478 RepID=UPI000FD9E2FC|nr:MATE family efflux transporter [Mesorhizobium sp. Z1-4]